MAKKEKKIDPENSIGEKYFKINSRIIVRYLVLILFILIILGLVGQYLRVFTPYEEAWGLIPLVYMGRKLSVPTIFQVLLLFLSTILLAIIAAIHTRNNDAFRKHWVVLAFAAFFLSLNEGSSADILIFIPLRNFLRDLLPGWKIFRWHITLILSLTALLVFYRGFLRSLPNHTRKWMLIALSLYLIGFTGNRIMKSILVDHFDESTYMYAVLRTVSKSFEISGAIAMVHSLLTYIKFQFPKIEINIEKK